MSEKASYDDELHVWVCITLLRRTSFGKLLVAGLDKKASYDEELHVWVCITLLRRTSFGKLLVAGLDKKHHMMKNCTCEYALLCSEECLSASC